MLELCNQPAYQSRPPAYIVADQLDQGHYPGSASTLYRVLREHGQQHRRGRQCPQKAKRPPVTHTADAPNDVWSWDITWLPGPARGTWFHLYLIMDIYSRKIVGHEVYSTESGEQARDVVEKACWREHLQARERPLVLHSDNGSPMKGATMLATLQRLGVVPSFSRPSVSDDNPFSESLFRTLKYSPAYPRKPFGSLEEARHWVHEFVTWYNHEHRHSAIKFVTPEQRHAGLDRELLQRRHRVYQEAKARNPARWSKDTRNWDQAGPTWLNPPKDLGDCGSVVAEAA